MRHIRAIFFDLDGTLLENDMRTFLPPYLQAVAGRVAHLLPPEQFIGHLLRATAAMAANDGSRTNAELFADLFYPLVGLPRDRLEPIFEDFYARDFPLLQQYTRRKPDARPLVQLAFDKGYDVAIATNPLFPETAVRRRLEWAGVDDFPYGLVTTYENSRYCKPNPGYFADIAAHLGRPPEVCLMVGDEAMDMAAAAIGCTTYLVPGPATELPAEAPQPTYRGTLAGLARLLDRRQPA